MTFVTLQSFSFRFMYTSRFEGNPAGEAISFLKTQAPHHFCLPSILWVSHRQHVLRRIISCEVHHPSSVSAVSCLSSFPQLSASARLPPKRPITLPHEGLHDSQPTAHPPQPHILCVSTATTTHCCPRPCHIFICLCVYMVKSFCKK